MALAWTGRSLQAGDPGPWWPDPGPDILWSAPEIAGMPADIGLGDAGHPREWPCPGLGGPRRRAIQGHGGRTPDRTFYGPHPKPPECPPALVQSGLSITGRATAWRSWGPGQVGLPVGKLRQASPRRRSKSGHSKVRTPLPGDPHQHSVPRGYVRSSGFRSSDSRLPKMRF
jgi:hypothetical protein